MRWKLVALSAEDIGKLKYAAWPTWEQLSGGTRLLADGAAEAQHVVVEGHSRLTAYCSSLEAVDEVTTFAGYSAMNNWGLMKL